MVMVQPLFTPTPSNPQISMLFVRYHAETIFKDYAKVRISAQFEILNRCRRFFNEKDCAQFTLKVVNDSYWVNSKVAFLKSATNATWIRPFFLWWPLTKLWLIIIYNFLIDLQSSDWSWRRKYIQNSTSIMLSPNFCHRKLSATSGSFEKHF